MYGIAKKLLSKIFGQKLLLQNEEALRSIFSITYTGKNHKCTICSKNLSRFIIMPNNDLLCPKCGSLSRDRRLWQLENSGYIKEGIKMLDFSPSRSLARRLKKVKGMEYISTDLSGNFIADHQYDITNIALPDQSIDLISCYHILEHIDNDKKAMTELYRVLKNNGYALVQTPFKEGDIYEDFSITSPTEREIHFGQDDHVRIYSVNGLKSRLESVGFTVSVKYFEKDVFHGLQDKETVLILSKN